MPTAIDYTFNAHHRTGSVYRGPALKSGDRVTWTNPSTGARHSGLEVEFIYTQLGLVLLRGDFGRVNLRTGAPSPETRRVRLDQVAVDAVVAEGV
jgi:hypothetical protein